jgi:heme/copper-type cytochrome/quinol oxidase subunit 2
MGNAVEIIILLAGIFALVLAAVTMGSLDKLKASCGDKYDTKQYKNIRNAQIVQLVVSALIILMAGWVLMSAAKVKGGYGDALPGVNRLSRYGRDLLNA